MAKIAVPQSSFRLHTTSLFAFRPESECGRHLVWLTQQTTNGEASTGPTALARSVGATAGITHPTAPAHSVGAMAGITHRIAPAANAVASAEIMLQIVPVQTVVHTVDSAKALDRIHPR